MRNILAVAIALPLFACTVGDETGGPIDDGDEHMDDPADPPPDNLGGVSGTIMSDTSWSGTTRIKATTTIPPGVTVTVPAGATLNFANSANIVVQGTLRVEGTSAAKVIMQSEPGASYWGPISVSGSLDVNYGDFTGGSINTQGTAASLVITDTKMYRAGGDYIIMNGGSINMTYSQVGAGAGQTDSTHCNLHINSATSITVTNSNINNAPYGLMFYGGINANFTRNNWYGANTKDVDTAQGVSGDFSNGWFEKGAPQAGPGATLTANNLAAARLTDVGPRP
jgi:hypothetical protein